MLSPQRGPVLDYIPINSIEDIDPRKISIRDINKRYVDRDGNRYATRFNLQTRRVEIVRLARNRVEAQRLREQIVRERNEQRSVNRPAGGDAAPSRGAGELSADEEMGFMDLAEMDDMDFGEGEAPRRAATRPPAAAPPSGPFYEQKFLDDTVSDLGKHKERLQVILAHLRTTRHYDANSEFQDLIRRIDVECWQRSEQAIGYFKELYGYPRSLNHYLPRLPPDERTRVEKEASDEKRLELIRRWEVRRAFQEALASVQRVTGELKAVIETTPEAARRLLPAQHQQLLTDSLTSIDVILDETTRRLGELADWMHRQP